MNLTDLPNIGPKVAQQLEAVGITSPDALREAGSREAWLRIQRIDASACIHRLLAMEGAIQGVPKAQLPENVKSELKQFYLAHKL